MTLQKVFLPPKSLERYAPTPNNLRATHLSADYNMLQLLGRVFLLATTVCGASTAGAVGEAGAAGGGPGR